MIEGVNHHLRTKRNNRSLHYGGIDLAIRWALLNGDGRHIGHSAHGHGNVTASRCFCRYRREGEPFMRPVHSGHRSHGAAELGPLVN